MGDSQPPTSECCSPRQNPDSAAVPPELNRLILMTEQSFDLDLIEQVGLCHLQQ